MRTYVDYRSIWERANGKTIPVGYHIHHRDGDSHNNDPSNLICVSHWEHYLIHKRQGDVREAALLLSSFRRMRGAGQEIFRTYKGIIPNKDSKALYYMSQGLIRVPAYSKESPPEVELMSNMNDLMIEDDPYFEIPIMEDIEVLLSCLNVKERFIIESNFGIGVDKKSTANEIAKDLGMSRSGVAKAKQRAIKKIKNNLENYVVYLNHVV